MCTLGLYWFRKKKFDSINVEVLWYKMRKKGVREKNVECIKTIYDKIGLLLCIKWRYGEVTEIVKEKIGVREGCSLNP